MRLFFSYEELERMEIDEEEHAEAALLAIEHWVKAAEEVVREPGQQSRTVSRFLEPEHQLIKVPYEVLKKSIRVNSRAVEKEMTAVTKSVSDVVKKEISRDETVQHLNSCLNRLTGLKRKLSQMYEDEEHQLKNSRARLDYLNNCKENNGEWRKKKLDRLIADYLLRSSYLDTATKLIESSSIQDLADVSLFKEAQKVIDDLRNRSCTKALSWCSDNKGRLKKAECTFEFKLRVQELVELVRAPKPLDALKYARKFLSPFATPKNMVDFQNAVSAIVFSRTSQCPFYKALLDESQWEKLIEMFKEEFLKMHGMSLQSLLHIHFQAGLSALKTPSCYEEGCRKEDPLSVDIIRKLADPLPFTKHTRSKLVCYITKEFMDEHNPPLVLPNGYVYSYKALRDMAEKNEEKVTCPRTGEIFPFAFAVRAFVS